MAAHFSGAWLFSGHQWRAGRKRQESLERGDWSLARGAAVRARRGGKASAWQARRRGVSGVLGAEEGPKVMAGAGHAGNGLGRSPSSPHKRGFRCDQECV